MGTADKMARKILNNPRFLVGNFQDEMNMLNTQYHRDQMYTPEPLGALGSRYPSDRLMREAEKAREREATESRAEKTLANAAAQTIQENMDLHECIDKHMQKAKDELQQA